MIETLVKKGVPDHRVGMKGMVVFSGVGRIWIYGKESLLLPSLTHEGKRVLRLRLLVGRNRLPEVGPKQIRGVAQSG